MNRFARLSLGLAILLSAPGLAPYQAAAQTMTGRVSVVAPGASSAAGVAGRAGETGIALPAANLSVVGLVPALTPASAPVLKTVAVGMTAMAFDPPAVTVAAGDTIQWTNGSFIAHTVTFDPAQAGKPADVALPGGVAPFGSSDLGEGDSFSHTFTVKGTYKYVCKYHEEMGMVGTVTVT